MSSTRILTSFPSISEEDFRTACTAFEQRCHDQLDDTDWMSVCVDDAGLNITMSLPAIQVHPRGEQSHHQTRGFEQPDTIEDNDLPCCPSPAAYAIFSVLRSPTYRVPVLWTNLHRVSSDGPKGVDAIYHYLVPESIRSAIRNIGILGGISFGVSLVLRIACSILTVGQSHPITSLPCFFIHPCNTQEALRDASDAPMDPERYLVLWLGLVGPSLSLYVPSKLMVSRGVENHLTGSERSSPSV